MVPFEYLTRQDYEAALAAYRELRQKRLGGRFTSEQELNRLGYELMNNDQLDLAVDIFRINVDLYPASSNVYDSLGEAYLKQGDKALAAKYYQKSLQLDPDNKNALKILKELGVVAKS